MKSKTKNLKLKVVMTETESGHFFAFYVDFPQICTQADTEKEAMKSLRRNLNIFIKHFLKNG